MNNNSEREYWSRAVSEVLIEAGITIEELADRMNVSARQVRNWKRGQRPCGLHAVRFYAFRVSILEPIVPRET